MEWALMNDVLFDDLNPMADFGTPIISTDKIDLVWSNESDASL